MSLWGTEANSFPGIDGDRLTLTSETISTVNPGNCTSGFRLNSDGQVYKTNTSNVYTASYNWVTPTSSAHLYECVWTAGTGTVDATPGSAGSALALTSSRTWSETNTTTTETASFTVVIRVAGSTTPLASATITLEVDATP